jgi:hypothetical protein
MFTSAECQAIAEQKFAEAERDEGHSKRLIAAAEGWLLLARRLNEIEVARDEAPLISRLNHRGRARLANDE